MGHQRRGLPVCEVKSTHLLPGVPDGMIVKQSPDPRFEMGPGGTVTYYMSTSQRPSWWTNWPSGWDPLTAPSDWWGGAWPPDGLDQEQPVARMGPQPQA